MDWAMRAGMVSGAAVAVALVSGAAKAEAPGDPQSVSEVVVTGQREARSAGQVSTTPNVGLLGDRGVFDTPFSTASYTDKLIQDQQARSLADLLDNNPSIRTEGSTFSDGEDQNVRGFDVGSQSLRFNDVGGLIYARRTPIEAAERVDVFLGPNALLDNDAPVGGSINLAPKRAGDVPLTRVIASYVSDSDVGLQVDTGRRFGPGGAFGVRVNLAGQIGDTPIDNQDELYQLGALALDYRSDRLKLSLDYIQQRYRLMGFGANFSVAPGIVVPDAPDSSSNVFDRAANFSERSKMVLLKGEYRVTDAITVSAAYGHLDGSERYVGGGYGRIIDSVGDVSTSSGPYHPTPASDVAQVRASAAFATGPIRHRATFSFDGNWGTGAYSYASYGTFLTNLYHPVNLGPLLSRDPGDENPPVTSSSDHHSFALADVATLLNGRLTLIGGVRRQTIEDSNIDGATGATTSRFSQTEWTPAAAVLFKLTPRLSLYANYIQALEAGTTVEPPAANAGQIIPPFVSEQEEVGVKFDTGKAGLTLDAFQITQPNAFLDAATNRYGAFGEIRNRGVEATAFGEVLPGVRLLGGATYYDPVQSKTPAGTNDGAQAIGIPHVQVNLGAEWDVPHAKGLTLTSRVIYTGKEYLDAANTQSIPDWARFDLGARYALVAHGRPVTLRLDVRNVTDGDYWQSASQGYLHPTAPRTIRASIATDF